MASVAQIQANRLNAQKSTGPRTAAGKERASQNALKHGLLAREAVIQGEDPAEFEFYREGLLADLAPAGPVEAMLAERIVGLSWRLRRAERLQNAAFAALDEGEPTDLLEARHEEWRQLKGSEWDRSMAGVVDEGAGLGRLVVADFAEAQVLDRMLVYERRIETSLYRTMARLRQERQARPAAEHGGVSHLEDAMTLLTGLTATAAEPEAVPPSAGGLPAAEEPVAPEELGSFGAEVVAGGTTSDEGRATQPSSGALHASPLTLHDQSCETNPIPAGASCRECLGAGETREKDPISGGGSACLGREA